MANTSSDVKAEELHLPNPFEPINFKIDVNDEKEHYARFVVEPLERGFGLTIGNALRRVLLSALPGASVFAVEIEGVRHEFTAIPGVNEDVTAIILNLKDLVLKIDESTSDVKRLEVDFKGPGTLTAGDLVLPALTSVVNPELEIAHLSKEGHLKMTIYAANGRGYYTSEANKSERKINTIGVISTDSNYSPVVKVAYSVEPTRVEHDSKFDKLTLEITTNGSIKPHEALAMAAQLLVAHFSEFTKLDDIVKDYKLVKEEVKTEENKYQDMMIEELDLSVRSNNCLKRAGISTVMELTQKSEDEMMKVRNLGKKSLKEVKEKLASIGLHFRDYVGE
ncbi:MAG: DNA-directed RNA polymerase subunit alpha [Bacilli bacterium]|jgi:DNA-directed RNA polymerase subunit alpha|nr:DNA-directed RNA polymerase subunit alpha [Bacilli bacterium]MCH4210903.1 DNA-directed RNA polymerase subunit alpha [Bacilli bacterium]MCH4228118.1 DNA-directed RNA polymerase subunit alpha [Bacilli bacterium]MCH4278380.1 DNA-directed RNA polymerase subunit alpha [Bacilli bacterium]MCI2054576.1 DNA-directed RNA polymerase subunit alpha [Bacilli bacterium]